MDLVCELLANSVTAHLFDAGPTVTCLAHGHARAGIARPVRAGVSCRQPFKHRRNLGNFLQQKMLNDGQRSVTAGRRCERW